MAVRARSRPARGSVPPEATRSWSSTRSRPVTISVTGCSTWRRVFISMNQKPSGRRAPEPSTMNSTVPALRSRRPCAACTAASVIASRTSARHAGGGRFLDHLLVAALQRAVALEEVDVVARGCRRRPAPRCGAGASTNFSTSTRSSPKRAMASRAGGGERRVEVLGALDLAHALAAAAGDRLDQDRVADRGRLLGEQGVVLVLRRGSRASPARRPSPSAPWRRP